MDVIVIIVSAVADMGTYMDADVGAHWISDLLIDTTNMMVADMVVAAMVITERHDGRRHGCRGRSRDVVKNVVANLTADAVDVGAAADVVTDRLRSRSRARTVVSAVGPQFAV